MSEISHGLPEILMNNEDVKGTGQELRGNASDLMNDESRDDNDSSIRKVKTEERESSMAERKEQPAKRSQARPSPSRKNKHSLQSYNSHPSPQRPYMHESYPPTYHPANRAPYPPPHAMHGPRGPPPASGPYAPPPPYYAPHDHYRGPPPPYHQMPHIPHPSQYGHTGHYGHPPNMHGRPGPPPGYHPPPYGAAPSYSGGPHPAMGYHGAPPPHLQNFAPHLNQSHSMSTSDNNSISSSKSKGSHISRSTKSSHGGSKKRTIEGMHDSKDKSHAYSFRRTNSNESSSSTITAGNNASDVHPLKRDSPRKRDRSNQHSSYSSSNNNIFDEERFRHRRHPSGTSTASSLSGAFSLHSYDAHRPDSIHDIPMMKASPKRRKGCDSTALIVKTSVDTKSRGHRRIASPTDSAIDGAESSRFEQLTMNDMHKNREENNGTSLFMSLSTSPINHQEIDSTPVCKNTGKKCATKITIKTDIMEDDDDTAVPGDQKPSPFRKPLHIRAADTPTPPGPEGMADSEMMTDEHLLNRHLRGQTFTPLPHIADSGVSPSNAGFHSINQALSWSIAGDTPSLEDLATCSWEENEKGESKRPGSTTSHLSSSTREMVISPHNFSLWKEEHETNRKGDEGKDNDTVRLSMLSPHSEIGMGAEGETGTTTPLPLFFHDKSGSEERENVNQDKKSGVSKEDEPEHMHSMFMSGGLRSSSSKHHYPNHPYGWKHDGHGGPPTPVYGGSKPPTPLYAGSGVGFARSPLHGDGRDHRMMFGHPPPHGHNDRVRNLRGRLPPGSHMPPMPLHIPPPMSSHHPLTSPMGLGQHGKPMWSPHHGMPPPMASPHHMSPMDMSQSKRKCVPLKPPIPSKFQGDMDKVKGASVPEFTSLVNFPAHMSQKQSVNLPEGMRCCVMCGQACPCSNGSKKKPTSGKGKSDGSLAPRSSNGQEGGMLGDKSNYAIIPTQNKGLCTLCDVNVWVVVNSGLEIKWCKGCKNFRPWAAFGDKGLATKCLRCRERQREKYALQKEEKDKVRSTKGAKIKG